MRKLLFLVLVAVIVVSCDSRRRISNQNLSYLYSPGLNFAYPSYRVYNFNNDSARVFFLINASDLLFMNDDSLSAFKSSFSFSYEVLSNYESKLPLDTGTFFYSFIRDNESVEGFTDYFDVRATDGAEYVLKVTFSDLNRQQAVNNFIAIDRTGLQSPNNFILFDADLNKPLISHITNQRLRVKIYHNNANYDKVYLRYLKSGFPLSPPPFSNVVQKPLSYKSNESRLVSLSGDEVISLDKYGIYHFQFDTLEKEGLTLIRFEEDFPLLTSPENLIESIRYLTTRQEFDKILNSSDRKQAVDNYWLSMAGNRERARILIKSYYSRVQLANRFFTSYLEGWKSDRGIVYIIFGPPNSIYRSQTTESWSYSQNSFYGSLNFTFDKILNPFSNNDYQLRRNSYYEIPWYRAVDSWRDGRVVNDSY